MAIPVVAAVWERQPIAADHFGPGNLLCDARTDTRGQRGDPVPAEPMLACWMHSSSRRARRARTERNKEARRHVGRQIAQITDSLILAGGMHGMQERRSP